MKRLVVVDRSVRVVFHAVLVGSIYLLFAGHNQPGGGFVGGLVAGAGVAIHFVAGGVDDVRQISRFQPWTILGAGLLLAAATAIAPLVMGSSALEAGFFTIDGPLPSPIEVSSSLAFDIGVYLLVVGLVLMIFEAFGDEPPTDEELGR